MNPNPLQWKNRLYPALGVFAGLMTAQLIATFQVYYANSTLHRSLTAIHGAGYLTVPNEQAMGHLLELIPALCGGLFFTLSVGAGISLLSFAAAWAWDRIFQRKTVFLILALLMWLGFAAGVNWRGFSTFPSLYVVVIPPVVFAGTLKCMPRGDRQKLRRKGLLQLVPIIVLGLLWAPQMKRDLFIDIRDHLLLTSPLGERIVDFYYRYTLYPAEALKPLDQKLLKTCSLDPGNGESSYGSELRKKLSDHDFFETKNLDVVDLTLKISDHELLLNNGSATVLKIPTKEFLSRPEGALKLFSSLLDRQQFFRQLTFYSLLLGFPITLYVFVYSFFLFFMGRFFAPETAQAVTTILCFATAVLLVIPLRQQDPQPIIQKNLDPALESHNRQVRLTALNHIWRSHLEIAAFSQYRAILTSPDKAERYWLAKALGVSRNNNTHKDLLDLIKDPSPFVASAASFALGQRGQRKDIPMLLPCIKTSEQWYVQRTAYKALKALGWTQKSM